MREEMHCYLGGISKRLDCAPVITGGIEDHIHMLARLHRTISQADWVKELKRASSVWIKEKAHSQSDFSWQVGYGIFSVSKSQLDPVALYIQNQELHHRHRDFKDEFRALLDKHEQDYDERYVWD